MRRLLKEIWDRKLIYQGYKVVPYDPRIGATLSSHEVAQGYREVEDPSVYVRFPVQGEPRTFFLVWTTTPWTLPSNLLLAVHPEVEYVWVKHGDETLILAKPLVEAVLKDGEHEIVRSALGADLDGLRYERLFDYLPLGAAAARLRAASHGRLRHHRGRHRHRSHRARVRRGRLEHGRGTAAVMQGVGEDGYFLSPSGPSPARFSRTPTTMMELSSNAACCSGRGEPQLSALVACDTPLFYYATPAWYIRTSASQRAHGRAEPRHQMDARAHPRRRFGKWLENNIDWAHLARALLGHAAAVLVSTASGDYDLHRLGRRARAARGAQARAACD